MPSYNRGDVWLADLDPTRGHEQAGRRPCLIVSTNLFNNGPAGLVIVAPLTRRLRNIPTHVAVHPPEAGLRAPSFIMCEAVRSVATERLMQQWGPVSPATIAAVENRLRILLEL